MYIMEELQVGIDCPASNVQNWFMTTNQFGATQAETSLGSAGSNVNMPREFRSTQPVETPTDNVTFSNNAELSYAHAGTSLSGQEVENAQPEADGDLSRSRMNYPRPKTYAVKDKLKHPGTASKQSASTPLGKIDRKRPPPKRNTQRKPQLPVSDVRNDPRVKNAHDQQYYMWYQLYSQLATLPDAGQNLPAAFVRPGYQSVGNIQAPKPDPRCLPPYFPSTTHQLPPNVAYNQSDCENYYKSLANWLSGYYWFPDISNTGRQTPKIYPNPHIRAWFASPGYLLQVLPNRPLSGELACIELLRLSGLANEAVVETTKKTENDMRCDQATNMNRWHVSSNTSGLDSPDALSSIQCTTGDEESGDDADTQARALIALTWDRIDHVYFPGPLSPSGNLKHYVLAYLGKKLEEIQDRFPTDWESASLLISYLDLLVRNNGVIPPRDLVYLLLLDHEPQTRQFRRTSTIVVNSKSAINSLPYTSNLVQQARTNLANSISSLQSVQLPNGQQSPRVPYGMMAPNGNKYDHEHCQSSHFRTVSEVGGYSTSQSILRRAAATVVSPHASASTDAEDDHLDKFRSLLMYGEDKAVLYACDNHLWGHAFTLAHRMVPSVLEEVIKRFLSNAVAPADPIITLYQLKAGEIPRIVCDVANGSGKGEWRAHLAMILSCESTDQVCMTSLQRLGDSLLSRGFTSAAHLCYLLIGAQYDQTPGQKGHLVYHLPEKVWLLGVPSPPSWSEGLTAPAEAIQLTEVYEYAMQLANRNYRLAQLLPFRLMYATRLLDAGFLAKAYSYLEAIGNAILLDTSSSSTHVSPVTYSLIVNCLRLAEPLLAHPDLDDLDFLGSCSSPFPSNRWTSEMSANGRGSWIIKLRQLYDIQCLNNNLHREPMLSAKPSISPQLPATPPIQQHQLDYSLHQSQETQQNDVKHPLHQMQHTGQGNVKYERSVAPTGNHMPPDAWVCPRPRSSACDSPSVISRPRIKTEQFDGYTRDGLEDSQVTPTNIRDVNLTALSVSADLQKLTLSQPSSSDYQQSVSTPTYHDRQMQQHQYQPVVLNQLSAVPLSPTAVSSSSASFPVSGEQYSVVPHGVESHARNSISSMDSQQYVVDQRQGNRAPPSGQFFVPVPDEHALRVYDYFGGLHQQATPRSRKASGSSNADTVIQDDQAQYRHNSGASQVRRNSGNYGKPTFSSIQHQYTNQQQPRAHHPSNPYSGNHSNLIREVNEESTVEERPKPVDRPTASAASINQNQSKAEGSGWLRSFFTRQFKGQKDIHLPDDKHPSIIWDEERKMWINRSEPDAPEPVPPPPRLKPVDSSVYSSPPVNSQTNGSGSALRGGARPRYALLPGTQSSGPAASRIAPTVQPPLHLTASSVDDMQSNVTGDQC